MCGRIASNISGAEQLMEQFLLHLLTLEAAPRFNVAPSQQVIAVVQSPAGERTAVHMRWGLIPRWAKDASIGWKMINARSETVAEKPAFRSALRNSRCIVVASGFYEWRREGKQKTPFYFYLPSGALLALAGLWDEWRAPDGQVVQSCTIITTAANTLVQPVHDRMPVLLGPAGVEQWLDHSTYDLPLLLSLLQPYPAAEMDAYQVSSYVNSPAHEGPECIARVAV